jgi:hypothetical protein
VRRGARGSREKQHQADHQTNVPFHDSPPSWVLVVICPVKDSFRQIERAESPIYQKSIIV